MPVWEIYERRPPADVARSIFSFGSRRVGFPFQVRSEWIGPRPPKTSPHREKINIVKTVAMTTSAKADSFVRLTYAPCVPEHQIVNLLLERLLGNAYASSLWSYTCVSPPNYDGSCLYCRVFSSRQSAFPLFPPGQTTSTHRVFSPMARWISMTSSRSNLHPIPTTLYW